MKFLFCDLDGTLWHNFYQVIEADIAALKLAKQKGIHIGIATGRVDYEIKEFMNKYHFSGYRISQNGGVIFNEQDEMIYHQTITTGEVEQVIDIVTKLPCLVFIQTPFTYYTPKRVKIIEEFEKNQPFIKYVENTNIFNEIENHEVITVSLWLEKDENKWVKKQLDKCLPPNLIAYISSAYTIDITHKVNSKGNAIKFIMNKEGLKPEDIYVIGDSYNDISMFEITPNSYCMAEAEKTVQAKAMYVVDSVKDAIDLILK